MIYCNVRNIMVHFGLHLIVRQKIMIWRNVWHMNMKLRWINWEGIWRWILNGGGKIYMMKMVKLVNKHNGRMNIGYYQFYAVIVINYTLFLNELIFIKISMINMHILQELINKPHVHYIVSIHNLFSYIPMLNYLNHLVQ